MAASMKKCVQMKVLTNIRTLLWSFRSIRLCSTRRVSIKDLFQSQYIGKKIHITGWVRSIRKQKENLFMDINDGSTFHRLQVIFPSSQSPRELSYGSSVEMTGTLVESSHSGQPFEIKPDTFQVHGCCDTMKYPIYARRQLTMDYIRQFPHLRPRTKVFGHILRIRSAATLAVHEVFEKLGFIHINTPIITSNDCEGAGEAFIVENAHRSNDPLSTEGKKHFFDKEVFLSVSGQFHLEAMASALTNVYTIGPTFRAENSRTRHHMSEFYMIEAEMAFMSSVNDLCQFIEMTMKLLIERILNKCPDDLSQLHKYLGVDGDITKLIEPDYKRMTYTEAIDKLKELSGVSSILWGQDLLKEHEKRLVEYFGGVPVFITNFPAKLKPFYMKSSDSNPDLVEAVDLLVPEVGELCGGSIREHRLEEIENKIQKLDLAHSLQWYLDLRSFGTCPHGGFGMGFERLLQSILKIPNIKDAIPFPRWTHHCLM